MCRDRQARRRRRGRGVADQRDPVGLGDPEVVDQAAVAWIVATTFIRADGTHAGIAMNDRTSGPDLYAFARIPHRICAVSGNHKIAVLHAALIGGLITDLVIDPMTAQLLLDQYGGQNGS